MKRSRLPIILTADVGPALATLRRVDVADADWEPTMAALPVLHDAVARIEDLLGLAVPLTWFVRADDYVAAQFGTPVHVAHRLLQTLDHRWCEQHEFAWMPELGADRGGARSADALARACEGLRRMLPGLQSVRMGNLSHDNVAMAALDQLGLRFDCSAVPGRRKDDPGWCVDWVGTPQRPYQPSHSDYRIPGTPHRDIVEIPMQVLPMQADYDKAPRLRYVNPCFLERYLWPALGRMIGDTEYLVCLFHPDELFPEMTNGHPMSGYSPALFQRNMELIVEHARARGREPFFVRVREIAALTPWAA